MATAQHQTLYDAGYRMNGDHVALTLCLTCTPHCCCCCCCQCVCADGWIGFDCRIPVCKQGYYEPQLKHPTYLEAGKTKQGQYEACCLL